MTSHGPVREPFLFPFLCKGGRNRKSTLLTLLTGGEWTAAIHRGHFLCLPSRVFARATRRGYQAPSNRPSLSPHDCNVSFSCLSMPRESPETICRVWGSMMSCPLIRVRVEIVDIPPYAAERWFRVLWPLLRDLKYLAGLKLGRR